MSKLDKLNRRLEFTFKWGILVSGGALLTGVVVIFAILIMITALLLGEVRIFRLAFIVCMLASLTSIGLQSLSDMSEYYVDKYKALIRDQKNTEHP